jgi:hypothetical protein
MLPSQVPDAVFTEVNRGLGCEGFDHRKRFAPRRLIEARQLSAFILYTAGFRLVRIGEIMGRHHTTVYYAQKVVPARWKAWSGEVFRKQVAEIVKRLRERGVNINMGFYEGIECE